MRPFNPGRRPVGLAPGYYLRVPFGDFGFALAWLAEEGERVIAPAEEKFYPATVSLR